MVGWCDGAGSTSSAGASYNLDTVGQGPIALTVGAGGGGLDIFTLVYPFSPLSPSLWETARYRLKYCLKGPLNPKQPTNQIILTFSHSLTSCIANVVDTVDVTSKQYVYVAQMFPRLA